MATVKKFEELEVWQKARELENKIFPLTEVGKLSKDFKLRDQINAASGSVMDNIAEGFGRGSRLEFIQFSQLQEVRVRKFSRNCIAAVTGNIFQ
ncbi:MAG: four helix bundle protein [Bacteroidota bacterium]